MSDLGGLDAWVARRLHGPAEYWEICGECLGAPLWLSCDFDEDTFLSQRDFESEWVTDCWVARLPIWSKKLAHLIVQRLRNIESEERAKSRATGEDESDIWCNWRVIRVTRRKKP